MNPSKGAIINFAIKNKGTLFASYMPFIHGGGLFVPSTRKVKLGEEVFVLVILMDSLDRYPLSGKVVWISEMADPGKAQGFGIQLSGSEGLKFKNQAEVLLAGSLASDHPTFTM